VQASFFSSSGRSLKIDLRGGHVMERLVRPLMVVEIEEDVRGDVGAKGNNKNGHKALHGVSKRANWGHAQSNEAVRRLGCAGQVISI